MFDYILYIALLSSLKKDEVESSTLSQFNFYFENDFFYHTDKYYTNSVKLEWLAEKNNIIYNFGIVQDMYTPKYHELSFVEYGDHPYTGRVEGNFGASIIEYGSMLSLDVGIGYTGKYTYAEETMDIIHSLLPSNPTVLGWEYQTPTRALGRISISQKERFIIRDGYSDFISNIGANFSNFQSNIYAGYQWRVGWNLPNDFGLYSNLSKSINYQDRTNRLNAYAMVGLQAEYIDNDLAIDDPSTPQHHQVGTLTTGFSLVYHEFSASMLFNKETKRFHSQDSKYFEFVTILIGYRF
ncbi:MAG: lipid A deacylase LpxR family protein [Sulfurovum sp.]|nr:lipid A deacylase LpxR family protein [Sulfurovaceae bacterium]